MDHLRPKTKTKLRGCNPQANYTGRATRNTWDRKMSGGRFRAERYGEEKNLCPLSGI
jgi:hypothetical protein